jgi:hypothetical protein
VAFDGTWAKLVRIPGKELMTLAASAGARLGNLGQGLTLIRAFELGASTAQGTLSFPGALRRGQGTSSSGHIDLRPG